MWCINPLTWLGQGRLFLLAQLTRAPLFQEAGGGFEYSIGRDIFTVFRGFLWSVSQLLDASEGVKTEFSVSVWYEKLGMSHLMSFYSPHNSVLSLLCCCLSCSFPSCNPPLSILAFMISQNQNI